ncbi:cytochrome P450 [Phanerochaete sordida]|uniref:Cytochrome P450 n=1 Tax=Phanerochaete sordida TaxID=48140 RepID=A0A9P3LJ70_9APHY|nr:cytochrome P450 [Phanerochaete sordida]
MDLTTLVPVAILLAFVVIQVVQRRRTRRLSLPPGPPADPLIGHLRLMPNTNDAAEVFHGWAQTHGDVMSLDILGKRLIILSSQEAATDLLERRGSNYADRPSFPMYERIGWKDALVFLPYGPYFKRQRKMIQSPFEKDKVAVYAHIQEQEACVMLYNFLNEPGKMDRHVHRYTTAMIMEIAYGHRILSEDDEYLRMAEEIIDILSATARPSLLDVSPIFDKLPSWFPGAWFIKYIEETKPIVRQHVQNPISDVQRQLAAGTAKSSFVSHQLEDLSREGQLSAESRYDLGMVAHMIFGGGSETSYHTIVIFLACMLMNPEVQRKGQEEIDKITEGGRLPDFTDRDALPYVDCIVKETMRWHPVFPSGLPHRAVDDDEYRGMRIPKGAFIIANARSITWDPRHFHDPQSFKPERFLPKPEGAGEIFPQGAVFGWGRRICPGRYLALDMVWIAVARILAVFDIQETRDGAGNIIKPNIEFGTALTSYPKPFPCDLRPRSKKAADLIKQGYDMHMADVDI